MDEPRTPEAAEPGFEILGRDGKWADVTGQVVVENGRAVLKKGARWGPVELEPGDNRDNVIRNRKKILLEAGIDGTIEGSATTLSDWPLPSRVKKHADFTFRILHGQSGTAGSAVARSRAQHSGSSPYRTPVRARVDLPLAGDATVPKGPVDSPEHSTEDASPKATSTDPARTPGAALDAAPPAADEKHHRVHADVPRYCFKASPTRPGVRGALRAIDSEDVDKRTWVVEQGTRLASRSQLTSAFKNKARLCAKREEAQREFCDEKGVFIRDFPVSSPAEAYRIVYGTTDGNWKKNLIVDSLFVVPSGSFTINVYPCEFATDGDVIMREDVEGISYCLRPSRKLPYAVIVNTAVYEVLEDGSERCLEDDVGQYTFREDACEAATRFFPLRRGHLGRDVQAIELRFTAISTYEEQTHEIEVPERVCIRRSVSDFVCYRGVYKQQRKAGDDLWNLVHEHIESIREERDCPFRHSNFVFLTPNALSLEKQTVRRLSDRACELMSACPDLHPYDVSKRVLRFAGPECGDPRKKTPPPETVDEFIEILDGAVEPAPRLGALLNEIRSSKDTLTVILYDECHKLAKYTSVATNFIRFATTDDDLKTKCIFIGISATAESQLQALLEENCALLKSRAALMSVPSTYCGRKKYLEDHSRRVVSACRENADEGWEWTTNDALKMEWYKMTDQAMPECPVVVDYLYTLHEATPQQIRAGEIKAGRIAGTDQALNALCTPTDTPGLVVVKLKKVKDANTLAEAVPRILRGKQSETKEVDAGWLSHIRVWTSSAQGIRCHSHDEQATCFDEILPSDASHSALLVLVDQGSEGDTFPSPFRCYDVRARYGNLSKKQVGSWATLQQVVGRAYGHEAPHPRPLLLITDYALEALRDPSESKLIGPLLKVLKSRRDEIVSGRKRLEKLLKAMQENEFLTAADRADDEIDDEVIVLGILDAAHGGHAKHREERSYDNRFFLLAEPQCGKTGTIIHFLYRLQQHWPLAGFRSSAFPYPSRRFAVRKGLDVTWNQRLGYMTFDSGKYGALSILFGKALQEDSRLPYEWAHGEMPKCIPGDVLVRRLDFLAPPKAVASNAPAQTSNNAPCDEHCSVYELPLGDGERGFLSLPDAMLQKRLSEREEGRSQKKIKKPLPRFFKAVTHKVREEGLEELCGGNPPVFVVSRGRPNTALLHDYVSIAGDGNEPLVLIAVIPEEYEDYRRCWPGLGMFVLPITSSTANVSYARNRCITAASVLGCEWLWVADDNIERAVIMREREKEQVGSVLEGMKLLASNDFTARSEFACISMIKKGWAHRVGPARRPFSHTPGKCVVLLNVERILRLGERPYDEREGVGEDLLLYFRCVMKNRAPEKEEEDERVGGIVRFNRCMFKKAQMQEGGCADLTFRPIESFLQECNDVSIKTLLNLLLPRVAPKDNVPFLVPRVAARAFQNGYAANGRLNVVLPHNTAECSTRRIYIENTDHPRVYAGAVCFICDGRSIEAACRWAMQVGRLSSFHVTDFLDGANDDSEAVVPTAQDKKAMEDLLREGKLSELKEMLNKTNFASSDRAPARQETLRMSKMARTNARRAHPESCSVFIVAHSELSVCVRRPLRRLCSSQFAKFSVHEFLSNDSYNVWHVHAQQGAAENLLASVTSVNVKEPKTAEESGAATLRWVSEKVLMAQGIHLKVDLQQDNVDSISFEALDDVVQQWRMQSGVAVYVLNADDVAEFVEKRTSEESSEEESNETLLRAEIVQDYAARSSIVFILETDILGDNNHESLGWVALYVSADFHVLVFDPTVGSHHRFDSGLKEIAAAVLGALEKCVAAQSPKEKKKE